MSVHGGTGPDLSVHGKKSENGIVRSSVRAVRRGEREEFRHLVDLFQNRVYGLALMIVRNPSGAEEITQDAFMSAYTHFNLYDRRRPFYPWLATITVRHAQTWLNRYKRLKTREGTEIPKDIVNTIPDSDPLDRLISEESGRTLWKLVSELPLGQRTAAILHYRQDMKIKEIAYILGVTGGTVKTLLFRARKNRRQAILQHEDMNGFAAAEQEVRK